MLAFAAGLVAGGMLSAAVAVVLGSLVRGPVPPSARYAISLAVLGILLLREVGVLRLPLPQQRRLVPESVFRLGRHLGPLQFGIEMGTGVRTYLPSGLPYALLAAVALLARWPDAVLAGAGFGLGRALMTTAALSTRDGGWDARWQRSQRWLAPLLGAALAVLLVGAGPG